MPPTRRWTGAGFVLGAATIWGTTGTVAKLVYDAGISPVLLAAARMNVAAGALFLYLLVFRRHSLRVPLRELPHLALFGLIGLGLCQYTYLYTITQASVGVAVLLQSTAPFLIYTYALLRGQERLYAAKASALLLALAGCTVIVLGKGGWGGAITASGLLAGLLSAVFLAFYSLRAQPWLHRYSPWTIICWGMGFAALAWWFICPPWLFLPPLITRAAAGAAVIYLGIFTTAVSFGLYLHGVALLMPSTASIIGTFEPVAAALVAFVVLGERLTLWQVWGGALIIGAIMVLQTGSYASEKLAT